MSSRSVESLVDMASGGVGEAGERYLATDKRFGAGCYHASLDLMSVLAEDFLPDPSRPFKYGLGPDVDGRRLRECGFFMVPNFTERLQGWNDDTDHASPLVAFSSFMNHALSCIRTARILIYSCGAVRGNGRRDRFRDAMTPFLDLSLRFKNIAQGLDLTTSSLPEPEEAGRCGVSRVSSAWSRVVSGIMDVRSWWRKQISDSCEDPSRPPKVVDLQCVCRLNAMLVEGPIGDGGGDGCGSAEAGVYLQWMLGHVVSILLSASSKMLSAVGVIGTTCLYEFDLEDRSAAQGVAGEEERRGSGSGSGSGATWTVWKNSWDANMHALKSTGLLSSMCQYEGIGRCEDGYVWTPRLDGAISEIMDQCYRFVIHSGDDGDAAGSGRFERPWGRRRRGGKGSGGAEDAARGDGFSAFLHDLPLFSPSDSPILFDKTKAADAYRFCKRGMLFLMLRLSLMVKEWETLPSFRMSFLPCARWDVIIGHGGHTFSTFPKAALLRPDVFTKREITWTGLKVNMRQVVDGSRRGSGSTATSEAGEIHRYERGCVLMTAHIIEMFRPCEVPGEDDVPIRAQIYTVLINPASWGQLGRGDQ